MDNNVDIQQPKPDLKGKAIASVILGAIIIIIFHIENWLYGATWPPTVREISPLTSALSFLLPILYVIIGLIGLVLGRKGSRSPSIKIKIVAAIGMILCIFFGLLVGFALLFGSFLYSLGVGR